LTPSGNGSEAGEENGQIRVYFSMSKEKDIALITNERYALRKSNHMSKTYSELIKQSLDDLIQTNL
jgi:hypothetical protein